MNVTHELRKRSNITFNVFPCIEIDVLQETSLAIGPSYSPDFYFPMAGILSFLIEDSFPTSPTKIQKGPEPRAFAIYLMDLAYHMANYTNDLIPGYLPPVL